jgi:predicted DNA-binding protein (MmcQ/YjbR family)
MPDIDTLRSICKKLPGVTEDIKWGHDLVFSVGQKMFAVTGLEQPFTCSFKVPDEDYEDMIAQPGISPAPYMARNKWVLLSPGNKVNKKEFERLIQQSHKLVSDKLSKKLRTELGLI